MKTLYLLRHAKASGNFEDYADIDRPLKSNGISDAYSLGKLLKNKKISISKVVASDACRALQTATIVVRESELPSSIIAINHDLYLPEVDETTVDIIKSTPKEIPSLMIVGHNPNLSVISKLYINDITLDLPTCGLIAIEFQVEDWQEIDCSNSKKLFSVFPK